MFTRPAAVYRKTHKVGTVERRGYYVEIELRDRDGKGLELSICGEHAHTRGNGGSSFGQNYEILGDLLRRGRLGKGWTVSKVMTLSKVWKNWHLNSMRPGCKHQMEAGWHKRPIDPHRRLDAYGRHFPGQKQDSWNMLAWISPDEHPEGLLGQACPVCGFKYGTAWMHEDLPQEVIDFIKSLPGEVD